jgi:hypothetical protein
VNDVNAKASGKCTFEPFLICAKTEEKRRGGRRTAHERLTQAARRFAGVPPKRSQNFVGMDRARS